MRAGRVRTLTRSRYRPARAHTSAVRDGLVPAVSSSTGREGDHRARRTGWAAECSSAATADLGQANRDCPGGALTRALTGTGPTWRRSCGRMPALPPVAGAGPWHLVDRGSLPRRRADEELGRIRPGIVRYEKSRREPLGATRRPNRLNDLLLDWLNETRIARPRGQTRDPRIGHLESGGVALLASGFSRAPPTGDDLLGGRLGARSGRQGEQATRDRGRRRPARSAACRRRQGRGQRPQAIRATRPCRACARFPGW